MLLFALMFALADSTPALVPDTLGQHYLHVRHTAPFTDTLRVLFGGPIPEPLAIISPDSLQGGEYMPQTDSITLNLHLVQLSANPLLNDAPAMEMDEVFVHELVHRTQARQMSAMDDYFSQAPSIQNSHHYGYKTPREHMARAIAGAVNWLRHTASDTTGGQSMLDSLERTVPGTMLIALRLRHHPIYQRHPLALLPTYTPAQIEANLWSPDIVPSTPGQRTLKLGLLSAREIVAARLALIQTTSPALYPTILAKAEGTYKDIAWDVAQFVAATRVTYRVSDLHPFAPHLAFNP